MGDLSYFLLTYLEIAGTIGVHAIAQIMRKITFDPADVLVSKFVNPAGELPKIPLIAAPRTLKSVNLKSTHPN